MDSNDQKTHDIVIVGGGIGGLATALALHRKGFKSIVIEKSDRLRATGAAIGIQANGWRALDQLGVSSLLRETAFPLERATEISIDKGTHQEVPLQNGEFRCLKRSELVNTLADALPHGTIHFGCQIVSIKIDPQTKYSTLQLHNGEIIHAKVLIGCDGSNSIVANFLGLNPPRLFASCAIRGLAHYPNGHNFSQGVMRIKKDTIISGIVPINNNSVYWAVAQPLAQTELPQDPDLIKQLAMESLVGFPTEFQELIQVSELDTLSFTHLRYRAPWDMLFGQFRKGTVTVAGDAMHVMSPILAQGGSSALEDAVVLARNMAQEISANELSQYGKQITIDKVEKALDQYLKERRMRVFRLLTQSYIYSIVLESVSIVKKFIGILILTIFFRDRNGHTKYDCGRL